LANNKDLGKNISQLQDKVFKLQQDQNLPKEQMRSDWKEINKKHPEAGKKSGVTSKATSPTRN